MGFLDPVRDAELAVSVSPGTTVTRNPRRCCCSAPRTPVPAAGQHIDPGVSVSTRSGQHVDPSAVTAGQTSNEFAVIRSVGGSGLALALRVIRVARADHRSEPPHGARTTKVIQARR